MDNVSLFALWFPIDAEVEVELSYDTAVTMYGIIRGTIVLVTPIGVIVEEREGMVLAPWAAIGTMRTGKGAAR